MDPVHTAAPADHPSRSGHPHALPVGSVKANGYVYDRAPMLVYWEMTNACGLACRHCRASAMALRSPLELTYDEGLRLLDDITGFGRPYPHVVFTGGDPLLRPDLEPLVSAATERGIGCSLAPAATGLLTRDALDRLKAAGIQNISLSLDGSTPLIHDRFRGVPGTFATTLECAQFAHDAGLPIQVNTLITDETLADLPAIYELMKTLGIMRWSLFYLISVGRGAALKEVSPAQSERLNRWLFEISRSAPFQVKTTEAMHYRRTALKQMLVEGKTHDEIRATSVGRGFGIRDGNGIMFVNHDGEVYPSGFLPIAAGNVRQSSIVELYRSSTLFTSLRDPAQYKGRCGLCEYSRICGGSRARAYAWTGDPLESDPLCPYVPAAGTLPIA